VGSEVVGELAADALAFALASVGADSFVRAVLEAAIAASRASAVAPRMSASLVVPLGSVAARASSPRLTANGPTLVGGTRAAAPTIRL
jgi:hypothetical protein